ncbi:MAG: sigma-70 family RNA polymerase sigma factor [Acidobacteriales bacterium]|nr:sigma-70 family RNA polymerase sigma factor [Terriglobales bacterium]
MKTITLQQVTHETLAALRAAEDWAALGPRALYWVPFALKGFWAARDDRPDMIQVANVAALEALRTWPVETYPFGAYITLRVRGAVQNFLDQLGTGGVGSHHQKQEGTLAVTTVSMQAATTVSMQAEAGVIDSDDDDVHVHQDYFTYEDQGQASRGFGDPALELEREEEEQMVRRAVQQLPVSDSSMLTSLYVQDKTAREVGRELGVAHSTVVRRARTLAHQLAKTGVIPSMGLQDSISFRGARGTRPHVSARLDVVPGVDGRKYRIKLLAQAGGLGRESRPSIARDSISFRGARSIMVTRPSYRDNLSSIGR